MKKYFCYMKNIILLFFISCSVKTDQLRFSNTQEWDKEILKSRINEYFLLPMSTWEERLKVSPPPTEKGFLNKEVNYLLSLEKKRNTNDILKIKKEIDFFHYGKYGLKEKPLSTKKYKVLARMLNLAHLEIENVLLFYKEKFDRVRPSYLDKRLKPAIDVPRSPSYPSAHAAKAYMMAEVLTIVNPKGKEKYLKYARDIAYHRELAGVQYPSDTVAGRVLGVNFAKVLINREDFKAFFRAIKKEREKLKVKR